MNKFYVLSIFALGIYCGILTSYAIKPAKARIAGMSEFELEYDWDFKNAVKSIVRDELRDFSNEVETIVENKMDDFSFENKVESIIENCYVYDEDISCQEDDMKKYQILILLATSMLYASEVYALNWGTMAALATRAYVNQKKKEPSSQTTSKGTN